MGIQSSSLIDEIPDESIDITPPDIGGGEGKEPEKLI